MRYFSGAIYKLLKTLETRSKCEEILKISSICTCQNVESGKAVLKVNPLDEQLAKKCFLAAPRGGTVGGFGWDTASVLDSLVDASGNLVKSSDLEKLQVKIGNVETQLSEILKVLKKNGKPGADGEKRGGDVSVSESESDD
ncbi:hypothetical protein SLE2022_035880 [Rubroshorea leprosula]